MGRLKERSPVSPAASGIGLASAKAFVAEGACHHHGSREELNKAIRAISRSDGRAGRCGQSRRPGPAVLPKVRSDHGRIDVLFANAGLGALEPFGKITEAAFDLVFV